MMPSALHRPSSLALLAALLLAATATGALAADRPTPPSRAAARRLFERGTDLYQQARYAEAAEAFEAAYKAVPNGVVLYNLGQCYEKLGDVGRALEAYRDYLREVPEAEDRASVQTLVASLEARWQAQRRPRVSIASEPTGARVRVDGQVRGQTPWSSPLEVGPHQVQLTLEGYAPLQRTLEVRAGEPLKLELALVPLLPPTPALPAAPPAVAAARGPRVWTWVALGAAGAAAAGGLTYGLLARHDERLLLSRAHEQAEATALRDSAVGRARTANVLYGVAGAAALAGGALFFVEGSF